MRSRRPAALVAFVLATLPALAAPALAGPPAAADAARARHEAIIRHWTPERMRAAVPRDFVLDPATRAFRPAAKPVKPGGSVTGATWPDDKGLVYDVVGKVYFEMGGSGWICSGATARDSDPGRSIVLTAGHCAFDESAGEFATFWMFIPEFDAKPDYDCADTEHGCWTADALVVHEGYATAGSFNTQATLHDWAFAVVSQGGHDAATQLDSLGSFEFAATSYSKGTRLTAFGYPAAGKYSGNNLTYCAGPVGFDPYNGERTYKLGCDMTGGSSGGPWLFDLDETTGDAKTTTRLASVNSYGYSGVRAMHGPKFNADTLATWNAAIAGPADDEIVATR